MSDIQRYAAEQYPSPLSGKVQILRAQREYGPYVLWEDHCAEVERLTAERDRAQREVERLKAEVYQTTTACYEAQAEVTRLTDAANRQASLDSSRPTDEDIWREAYFASYRNHGLFFASKDAGILLADYRKRWPR